VRFLLTGSSARQARRSHPSLMAGRAESRTLGPFVSAESPDLDLERALPYGMLPPVVLPDTLVGHLVPPLAVGSERAVRKAIAARSSISSIPWVG